jgi:colanic acid biosynthesis glycosyl transferase WcaI
MTEKLRAIVGPGRRTCYVANWIHASLRDEIARQSRCGHTRHSGLLFYSGNVGVKQGLPDFLDQFKAADASGIGWRLSIHGGGAELERLRPIAASTPGCSFGPVLDETDYIAELMTSSACLVTQRPDVGANFLPSKLLPALASGTPVLAVCKPASPLGQEVLEGGYGEVVQPGDAAQLAAVLNRWSADPALLESLALRAKQRSEYFGRDRILGQYEQELLALSPRPVLHQPREPLPAEVNQHETSHSAV